MDAPGGQRGEQPGGGVDDLDGDVVARDEAAEPFGDALEDHAAVEGREDRLGDLQELALAADLALERGPLLAQLLGGVGVGHRLRRERGVDDEQPQVVIGELVESELREHDDAEHPVVEGHRGEQHRLVEIVLGAGDGVGSRVLGGVAEVDGDAVLGDPAGDALADRDAEHVGGLVDVLADLPLHRDGDELVPHQAIDADVVVVDELAELGRDGHADLMHIRQAVQSGAELLDRLELRGPRGHLLVVLGGADGDRRLGGERGHDLEVVVGPGVRPVVIDVEQADELVVLQERRGADRVVALLDDGGPHVLAARVVPVADREERPPDGRRLHRQRASRRVPDVGQVTGGQAAAHLGRDDPVGPAQEDGATVGFEEDHRVVDQAGEDAVEIEPAADVAGDAAQGLGAMQLAGGVVAAPGDRGDGADRIGRDRDELACPGVERDAAIGDDVEDAPGAHRTGDDRRHLHAVAGQDRQRRRVGVARGRATSPAAHDGVGEGLPEHPEGAGPVGQAVPGTGRTGADPRDEPLAAELPDRHEAVVAEVADRRRGGRQVLVEVAALRGQPGQRIDEGQLRRLVVGVVERRRRGGSRRRDIGRQDEARAAPPAGSVADRDAAHLRGIDLGRGEEALEVALAVASVTARIDPVVAQATGVAPRPHGVGVHAEEAGGLGDRQRRVGGTGGKGVAHPGPVARNVKSTTPSLAISQFLPIVRRSRSVSPGRGPRPRGQPPRGRRSVGRRRG